MSASLAMLHTAALRLREAADRFVVAFEQAAAEAGGGTALPPARPPRPLHPTTKTLLDLAGQADGVDSRTAARALGMAQTDTAGRLGRLQQAGKLFKRTADGYSVRFFATEAAADLWVQRVSDQDPPPPARGIRAAQQLAAMVEADAPAVAAALAVIAPAPRPADPPPSAPRPAPYIPPTPSMARGERREQLVAAAFVAPVAKPEGEAIVPPNVKRTVVNAPAFDARFQVDPKTVSADPESFSAQWARLRGLA